MRRVTILTLLLQLSGAAAAGAAGIGVGLYGGASIPVVNDLSRSGTQFGLRLPVALVPMVTVEPFYQSTSLGDVTQDFGTGVPYTRDGGSTRGFGVNALFNLGAPGFRMFPFVGIGSYTIERGGASDLTEAGYNVGFGLGFSAVPKLSFDVRAELEMIRTGETSRKYGNITGGVSYALFSVP